MNNKSYLHNLPELDREYELTKELIEGYQKNGHTIVRSVADDQEIMAYREVIADLVKDLNYQSKPMHERDTYGKAFIQIGNLWLKSEAVKRFVLAKRFAKIAADLMGVSGVRIYHDQALFKEPGGGHILGIRIRYIGLLIQITQSQCGCHSCQYPKKWAPCPRIRVSAEWFYQ